MRTATVFICCLFAIAIADHEPDDVGSFLEHLSGHDLHNLDHDVEEMHHDGIGGTDAIAQDNNHALLDDDNEMRDEIDHIGGVDDINAQFDDADDQLGDDVDHIHPHFEALSYGRKPKTMYKRKAPKSEPAASRYVPGNPNSPSGHGGVQKVDPNAPLAPTLSPSFDNFNNAKPQNDGNCLQALNKERQSAGVPELANNQTLVQMAAKHSAYMAASQTASHDGFWSYRFDAVPAGVVGVGEVVVADDLLNTPNGPAKRAVDRWMESPEHKMMLLRRDMVMVGCSTAEGNDGRFYATAIVCSNFLSP